MLPSDFPSQLPFFEMNDVSQYKLGGWCPSNHACGLLLDTRKKVFRDLDVRLWLCRRRLPIEFLLFFLKRSGDPQK